jgi:hypothetical protein
VAPWRVTRGLPFETPKPHRSYRFTCTFHTDNVLYVCIKRFVSYRKRPDPAYRATMVASSIRLLFSFDACAEYRRHTIQLTIELPDLESIQAGSAVWNFCTAHFTVRPFELCTLVLSLTLLRYSGGRMVEQSLNTVLCNFDMCAVEVCLWPGPAGQCVADSISSHDCLE